MAKKETVNLDALIPREDLQSKRRGPTGTGGIPVSELALGKNQYALLRKPHFQRETDDWSIDNVVTLIKSFRDAHLIPSVILWNAEGYTFVIDGAHRLSALIAWINDDYGDKQISEGFFRPISKRQIAVADKCRVRVRDEIGTYEKLSKLSSLPVRTPDQLRWSSNIARALETQWVSGDADSAAASFMAINQRAVVIDKTERFMIEHDKEPNVIAARALVRNAKGDAFWRSFEQKYIDRIEGKARLIYSSIFEPEDALPHANADLQPAGPAYTANGLRIALDMVNVVNANKGAIVDDLTGEQTARYIEVTHAVIKCIAGTDSASLGLHPAVYFWGATGNHRPSIFLAMVSLMQEMLINDELVKFTLVRARLEEFLVGNGAISKHLIGAHGGWKKSLTPIKKMLRTIIDGVEKSLTEAEIAGLILGVEPTEEDIEVDLIAVDKNVWRETKASLRHKASLESAPRCAICKARLVIDHASDDHKELRSKGGSSDLTNAQLTHKYCNTGFKQHFSDLGISLPEIEVPA